jgi:predicted Na+-dependent transporter
LLLGVVIILGVVPTLGFAAMKVPYRTLELQNGFALFIVMPTALGTVTLLTEQCDGNHVMATLLGIITNLVGPVSVPAFLDAVLGAGGDIDVKHMMWELVVIVLVPLGVGKGLQRIPAVSQFCIKYQTGFKLFQSIVLNIMPWTALSRAAPDLQRLSSADLLDLFGTCILLAMILTALALSITFFLPIATPDKKAILICSAMKTVSIPLLLLPSFLIIQVMTDCSAW